MTIQFTQIRSATVIIDVDGVRFLVDPMFGPKDAYPGLPISQNPNKRWPISELPYQFEEFPQYDAVIFTHLHIDHADPIALALLPKNTPVFAQDREDALTLTAHGFRNVRILEATETIFKGVRILRTNCLHGDYVTSKPTYDSIDMRIEASGVIFIGNDGKKLWLVGDSIWCSFIDNIIEEHQPDAVVINAARAGFTLPTGFVPIIMGDNDVVRMCKELPRAIVIASHLDCVPHATVTRKDLIKTTKNEGLENRVFIPLDGETVKVC